MLDFHELQKEEGGKRGFLSFGPLIKYLLKKQLKKRFLNNFRLFILFKSHSTFNFQFYFVLL